MWTWLTPYKYTPPPTRITVLKSVTVGKAVQMYVWVPKNFVLGSTPFGMWWGWLTDNTPCCYMHYCTKFGHSKLNHMGLTAKFTKCMHVTMWPVGGDNHKLGIPDPCFLLTMQRLIVLWWWLTADTGTLLIPSWWWLFTCVHYHC